MHAAAGAVGTILVQLLKRAGATVIGTARGEHKLALVKELGADQVVDYSVVSWTDEVRQATRGPSRSSTTTSGANSGASRWHCSLPAPDAKWCSAPPAGSRSTCNRWSCSAGG
ncbi:zinc-binding dehydrogenase [Streptomyces nogalater]